MARGRAGRRRGDLDVGRHRGRGLAVGRGERLALARRDVRRGQRAFRQGHQAQPARPVAAVRVPENSVVDGQRHPPGGGAAVEAGQAQQQTMTGALRVGAVQHLDAHLRRRGAPRRGAADRDRKAGHADRGLAGEYQVDRFRRRP